MLNENKKHNYIYHFTDLATLYKIIKWYENVGEFKLRLSKLRGKFRASFTRNPTMRSLDLGFEKYFCRITFSGEIYNNFKIKPYQDPNYRNNDMGEQEEELSLDNISSFSDNDFLKIDLTKYVIRIDILSKFINYKTGDIYNQRYPKLINKGIPIPYYVNKNYTDVIDDFNKSLNFMVEYLNRNEFPFPINFVYKYIHPKYQNRYLDKWNKKTFKYLKKFSENFKLAIK